MKLQTPRCIFCINTFIILMRKRIGILYYLNIYWHSMCAIQLGLSLYVLRSLKAPTDYEVSVSFFLHFFAIKCHQCVWSICAAAVVNSEDHHYVWWSFVWDIPKLHSVYLPQVWSLAEPLMDQNKGCLGGMLMLKGLVLLRAGFLQGPPGLTTKCYHWGLQRVLRTWHVVWIVGPCIQLVTYTCSYRYLFTVVCLF